MYYMNIYKSLFLLLLSMNSCVFFQMAFSSCLHMKDATVQMVCDAIDMVAMEDFLQGEQRKKDAAQGFWGRKKDIQALPPWEKQFQKSSAMLVSKRRISLHLSSTQVYKVELMMEKRTRKAHDHKVIDEMITADQSAPHSFSLASHIPSHRATCTSQWLQRGESEWYANVTWRVKLWLDQITKRSTVNGRAIVFRCWI